MDNKKMPLLQTLPTRQRLAVLSCVRKGRAPDDPHLAPAAIEAAEHYQGPGFARIIPWLGLWTIGVCSLVAIISAIGGDRGALIVSCLIIVGRLAMIPRVPLAWAENVTRSLEASRKLVR
jgi:hypothetical protein